MKFLLNLLRRTFLPTRPERIRKALIKKQEADKKFLAKYDIRIDARNGV